MSNSLRSNLRTLAESFAESVLDAIRSASLEELVSDAGGRGGAGRARALGVSRGARRSTGRLARRSQEQIAEALDSVVGLLKKHKDGLRAEQIRAELGMQAKEMPRVIVEGLSKRKLKRRGRKRATTYTAA